MPAASVAPPAQADGCVALEWAGATHRGIIRTTNEDAFSAAAVGPDAATILTPADGSVRELPAAGMLFVVADGVGGQRAGEVASALATAGLPEELARVGTSARASNSRDCGGFLETAIRQVNGRIRQEGAGNPDHTGLAATLSVLWFLGRRAVLGQVGDSRIFRFRDGRLIQLSHDQSQIARMQRLGQLSEDEARFSPLRSVVEQALGMRDEELTPEIDWLEVLPGDAYLLASDGLTDRLEVSQCGAIMATTLAGRRGLAAAASGLIAAANAAGGRDNVTVLLVRIPAPERAHDPASPPVARSRAWSRIAAAAIGVAAGVGATLAGVRLLRPSESTQPAGDHSMPAIAPLVADLDRLVSAGGAAPAESPAALESTAEATVPIPEARWRAIERAVRDLRDQVETNPAPRSTER